MNRGDQLAQVPVPLPDHDVLAVAAPLDELQFSCEHRVRFDSAATRVEVRTRTAAPHSQTQL